ncbi:MAG: type II secretion system protein [Candidatus Aureabacteria bacterium]|nr:type II secretion system protein [Candidatus Auribacterota bacterium]
MKNRNYGFTLVELVIAVTVMGFLAALAIPSLVQARKRAQKMICANNLRQFQAAMKQYEFEDNLDTGDAISPVTSLDKYLTNLSVTSACPAKGAYQDLDVVGSAPRCSVHGSLPF